MVECVTQIDLDAAQKALDELQTALTDARLVHEARIQAAEAAQAQEVDRLADMAQEAHEADDEDEDGAGDKVRKRYVAVHMAYNGHGFSGMQCNPNVRTIESELHSALVDTRAIHTCTPDSASNAFVQAPDAADGLRSIKWSRAARTDKGVSACGQVTSCWLSLVPNLTAKLNAALPSQIRVLGITRVRKSFNARHTCDSRRYEYYLPQWAFDPDLFPASPSWRPQSCPGDAAVLGADDPAPEGEAVPTVRSRCGKDVRLRPGYSVSGPPPASRFEFDAECAARLNTVLSQFEGVHNFHNFSPAVLAEQMSAQRVIRACSCEAVALAGEPWVRILVHGQSFLLNQIRKMVGLALAVFRGHAPADAIHMATDPQRNFGTPMAPELGLLLAESCFESYNRTVGPPPMEELSTERFQAALDAFKRDQIFPAMLQRDREEGVNYQFVEMLCKEERHFAQWRQARPIRNVKRPRTAAERAEKEERERKRAVRNDELLRQGVSRPRISEILREEFPKVPPGGSAAPAAAAKEVPGGEK